MRRWDTYDTYLFDIDGTLLCCKDAVHYFGFCHVLTEIAARPLNLDGVITQGNVDLGILRDAFDLAHVPQDVWRSRVAEMRDSLCGFVEAHAADLRIDVLPGVRDVLAYLRGRGATLGVATGNLERVGWAKLAACGLKQAFDFGGFSDLCENRFEVFAAALLKARIHNPHAAVCIIGDTPADVLAARENGLECIAVSTGTYSYEELQALAPARLVRSLEALLQETTGLSR